MTTLNLTLPNSIHRHIQEMADLDGVPVSQFIMSAVIEKISALTAESYLRTRSDRADPAAFQAILAKVPQRAPLAGDE
ncbi:MAG: CopG family transcriptional regulator [Rhodoferax ferrireducens]|uniref:CopG family transcriptional regulator n=1 Tax=Rhodoferax ferrireducens TaxID=192843 RepID=A0A1W9KTF0_9BURK|nr:MAG: CopG family transcriptional regulator [Rhodoferax ferrireducens]